MLDFRHIHHTHRYALLLFSILIVVVVSGCIIPTLPISPTTPSAGGLGVESFTTDLQLSEFYSEEPITFQIKFRNTGSMKANNVFAELLGLDEDWCCDDIGEGSWTIGKEKLPNEDKCRYTGDGFTMDPPNSDMGTQGESAVCSWSYMTPDIPKNIPSVPYHPSVRLFYSYKTIFQRTITFGSHQDLRNIQDLGGSLPVSSGVVTSSPVLLTLNVNSPVRFWTTGTGIGEVTFPIEINIENVGGGVACATDSFISKSCKSAHGGQEAKNKIKLKIDVGSDLTLGEECQEFGSGYGNIVSLWKGKSNSITCDVKVSGLTNTGSVQKKITLEAVYEYTIDSDMEIRVTGKN